MLDGKFAGSKEVNWRTQKAYDQMEDTVLIVKKTLEIWNKKPHDRMFKVDLCGNCLGLMEEA